jgi:hypothetical protein
MGSIAAVGRRLLCVNDPIASKRNRSGLTVMETFERE